jgi:cytochrome P450
MTSISETLVRYLADQGGRGLVPDAELGMWVASSYSQVTQALRDPNFSANYQHSPRHTKWLAQMGLPMAADALLSRLLIFLDPPAHTQVRRVVTEAMGSVSLDDATARWQSSATERLSTDISDYVVDFAFPIATEVACDVVGIPESHRDVIFDNIMALSGILELEISIARRAGVAVLSEVAKTDLEFTADGTRRPGVSFFGYTSMPAANRGSNDAAS